jgi:DNA-binding CsgD family transcriptional regulator
VEGVPGLKEVFFGDCDTPLSTMSLMSEDDFQDSAFYRNWARPQGLRDGCLVKFVHSADRIGLLGVITSASRDVISAEERRFLGLLSPHFRRASLISDLLDHERVAVSAYREALDGLGSAVILTDAQGAIAYANRAAETMMRVRRPIAAIGGRIAAGNPAMSDALADAISRAGADELALGARGIGIPVSAPGAPPAVAYVLPLTRGTARSAYQPAVAAVFISTSMSAPPAADATLITLFDLTPAEARVMKCIGAGTTADAAQQSLGISANTLKTHLSHIFTKTGANRQADLARLMAQIAPPVVP